MRQEELNIFESGMDETAKAYLLETTRWTKFLAIIGFITVGLIVLLAFLMLMFGTIMPTSYSALGALGSAIYLLVMAALYFYPAWALIKFSSSMKKGINTNNQELVNDGFRHQKNIYRYMGILTIIGIVFMLLAILVGGLGMIMNA